MNKLFGAHPFLSLRTGQSAGPGLTLCNWADAPAPATRLDLFSFRERRVLISNPTASMVFAFFLIYISRLKNELSAYTWQRLLVPF